ncbi:MAG: hypothetical protein QOE37_464, partial [Microbacteriaceae bacterium]|nr:hypothetical protein [Microbacteriaceae bacterium]
MAASLASTREGVVGVPMPGDPGAVEAGATQLTAMAEQFTGAGEGIRAAGGAMGSGWTGG